MGTPTCTRAASCDRDHVMAAQWLNRCSFISHNGYNDSARVQSCTRSGREHTRHGRADWDGTFFCSSCRFFFCSSVRLASSFALITVGEELTKLAILSLSHSDLRLLRIPAPEAD